MMGYKRQSSDGPNGTVGISRVPLEVIGSLTAGGFRFGAGIAAHFAPSFHTQDASGRQLVDRTLDTAFGGSCNSPTISVTRRASISACVARISSTTISPARIQRTTEPALDSSWASGSNTAILGDIATLTGGGVISAELGHKLENVKLEELGSASRVVIDKDSTAIIGGSGDKRAIADRIERLRREIREAKSDYDKEKLQERLAKLSGGVAVIRIGAATEAEAKSRKEAFEDAVNATKAAVIEGIVPGCGLVLLRAIDAVKAEEATCDGDERRRRGRRTDARRHRQPGLRRRARRVLRPGRGRHHRSDEGRARWRSRTRSRSRACSCRARRR